MFAVNLNLDLLQHFFVRGIVCVVITNLIYFFVYFRKIEFKDSLLLTNKMTKGKMIRFLRKIGMAA